jgi:hypothetical protein
MAVLSVDLATLRWSDLGIVVLDRAHSDPSPNPMEPGAGVTLKPRLAAKSVPDPVSGPITCEIICWNDPGPVIADGLAGRLNHLCGVRGIRVLMLDGPQAWKSRFNGLEHARVSEKQLNTTVKTGLPGSIKPRTRQPYAEFCLEVYKALGRRGWQRLETREQPGSAQERVLLESNPRAAWKSLGIKPLPAKRKTHISDLAEAFGSLRALLPFTVNRPPNHNQLQAIVGGLPGLALEERNIDAARIVGAPPRREEGLWREGFIVLPVLPVKPLGMRWLN